MGSLASHPGGAAAAAAAAVPRHLTTNYLSLTPVPLLLLFCIILACLSLHSGQIGHDCDIPGGYRIKSTKENHKISNFLLEIGFSPEVCYKL